MRSRAHLPFVSPGRRSLLPGTTLLVPLLAGTLVLSIWLGYQAVAAVRSHREAAEAALRDYAYMAAWQYAHIADDRLDEFFDDIYDDVFPRRTRAVPAPDETMRDMSGALDRLRCTCPSLRRPSFLFHMDLGTSVMHASTEIDPALLRRLSDTLTAHHVGLERHRYVLFSVPAGLALPVPATVAYAVRRGVDNTRTAWGFVAPTDAYGELLDRGFDDGELLPPAVTRSLPNDSLLHIAVRDRAGVSVFESAMDYPSTLAAFDTLDHEYGPLVIEAAVRPDAAARLIIGGLPRSKLPLILTLLVLTLAVGCAALMQLRRERQLAGLRDDFISGVSHELRTPLAQIRMFAELQETGRLRTEEDRARATTVIHREARRLTHLVDNILRFSRLRRSLASGLTREDIDVADALGELIEGFRPLAAARRMTIESSSEEGLRVLANGDALKQMLINLLDNAVKYGPTGQSIRVDAARRNGNVAFTIEDEGPGVPAADRERVFEPYYRSRRDGRGGPAGTGIGLAVVSQLAALHGGEVHVERATAGGARFVLELPIVKAHA